MDRQVHDLEAEVHDDLVLATLLAEDGHPDAARQLLDRPATRLAAVRGRLERAVADAAVERAAEEAIAGPVHERPGPHDDRAVVLRVGVAAMLWCAVALIGLEVPPLGVLGTETDPPWSAVSEREDAEPTGVAPSEVPRGAFDVPDGAPPSPNGTAPQRRASADRSLGDDDARGGGGADDRLLGLDARLGDLPLTDEHVDDAVEETFRRLAREDDGAVGEDDADADPSREDGPSTADYGSGEGEDEDDDRSVLPDRDRSGDSDADGDRWRGPVP